MVVVVVEAGGTPSLEGLVGFGRLLFLGGGGSGLQLPAGRLVRYYF